MKKDLRVAVVQARTPRSSEEGEILIKRLVQKALKEPVDMIGFPEDCVSSVNETKDGYDALEFLSRIAKTYKVYLFGANTTLKNNKIFNTGFLINKNGKLMLRYHKIMLTPLEKDLGISAGDSLKIVDTVFGKIGFLICRDAFHRYNAWFFEKLWKAKVGIVLIPAFSLDFGRSLAMWLTSLRYASLFFNMYIAAPGTVGKNVTPYQSYGHSLIVSPKEGIIAEGHYDMEEILRGTFSVKLLEDIRKSYGVKWQPNNVPKVKLVSI